MKTQGSTIGAPQVPTTRHIGFDAKEEDASELPEGRKIIVAIGINEYLHHPALNNPINDAQAILALFKQCGFQELPGVSSLVANDATRAAIADLPNRLATELTPDDNLVIFFAGHGEKKEREAPDPAEPGKTYKHRTGYLIPVDGPKDKPGDWIKLDGFLDDLSALPARHIFIILDACKSGIALADKFKVKGEDQPTAVAALRQLPSRRVLTSALHNERAAEGGSGSGHSLFAEALIAAIQDRQADKDGDGYIKTVDLFSFVQDRVSDCARTLFNLKQTPDYGYLAGDGSGDLVISLREGAFKRLVEEALAAMVRHDVTRLGKLVSQLIAANPTYPMTLYLHFRLKFMQGDYGGASHELSALLASDFDSTSVPLSGGELEDLRRQLTYWKPILEVPVRKPPIQLRILSGPDRQSVKTTKRYQFRSRSLYKVQNDSIAQFWVKNVGDVPAHLYSLTIRPNGKLLPLPLLQDDAAIVGLQPGCIGTGPQWRIEGLPGAVTETRVVYSPRPVQELLLPQTTDMREMGHLSTAAVADVQVTTIYDKITETAAPGPKPSKKVGRKLAQIPSKAPDEPHHSSHSTQGPNLAKDIVRVYSGHGVGAIPDGEAGRPASTAEENFDRGMVPGLDKRTGSARGRYDR